MARNIKIEVAYATPTQQLIIPLEVPDGTTIASAIERSGILVRYPEIDLTQQKVGVFSQARLLTDCVEEGERIEIYRPLLLDPKEARKLRAAARPVQKKNKNP